MKNKHHRDHLSSSSKKSFASQLPSARSIFFLIIFATNNILFFKYYLPSHLLVVESLKSSKVRDPRNKHYDNNDGDRSTSKVSNKIQHTKSLNIAPPSPPSPPLAVKSKHRKVGPKKSFKLRDARNKYDDNNDGNRSASKISNKIQYCLNSDEVLKTWSSNDNKCKRFWIGDAFNNYSHDTHNLLKYNVSIITTNNNREYLDFVADYITFEDTNNEDDNNDEKSKNSDGDENDDDNDSDSYDDYNIDIIVNIRSLFEQTTRKYPDLFIFNRILEVISTESSQILEEYNRNKRIPILLFLNGRSTDIEKNNKLRSVKEVIQSTKDYGFGCVKRPESNEWTMYHDTATLRKFSHPSKIITQPLLKNGESYNNYGDWLDKLNISSLLFGRNREREIVPVCYGSSFAVNAIDLIGNKHKIYKIIKPLITELHAYSDNQELYEFVERTWAMIFSDPLRKEEISFMKKSISGLRTQYPLVGSLTYNPITTSSLYNLWKGHYETLKEKDLSISDDYSKLRFTLVISYCHEDMSWLKQFFSNTIQLQDVIIYSKCRRNESLTGYFLTPKPKVINLPNQGRCDHSYANFMDGIKRPSDIQKFDENHENSTHVVFFLTASRDISVFKYKSLQDMIKIARRNGFSCAVDHEDRALSYYHDVKVMTQSFSLTSYRGSTVKSKYKNMEKWLQNLVIDRNMPRYYTPVCYGGNFATLASQIMSLKYKWGTNIWDRVENSLTRADSIEEGHFAERSWAGLLSYPLTNEQIKLLESIPSKAMDLKDWDMKGVLKFRYD